MTQLSSNNDDTALCYDVIITHQKFLKLTNFVIFRAISITKCECTYNEKSVVLKSFIRLRILAVYSSNTACM